MVQVMGRKQECAELQQQLQEQAQAHGREVADLARMTSKVQHLEFDLGNMRQSLQVSLLLLNCLVPNLVTCSHHNQSCCLSGRALCFSNLDSFISFKKVCIVCHRYTISQSVRTRNC